MVKLNEYMEFITDDPVICDFFISLRCNKKLTDRQVKKWYKLLLKFVPTGILSSVIVRQDDSVADSLLICKSYHNKTYEYIVPLVRHLIEQEQTTIQEQIKSAEVKLEFSS